MQKSTISNLPNDKRKSQCQFDSFWLTEWLRSDRASVSKEVICDSSRAFLIAIIRAFTDYLNIEDYANAFRNSNLPKYYIRIDVAHFIKLNSKIRKTLNKRVRTFYLAQLFN